jgi:hypothetical protein
LDLRSDLVSRLQTLYDLIVFLFFILQKYELNFTKFIKVKLGTYSPEYETIKILLKIEINSTALRVGMLMYFDVSTAHFVHFITQTNKCTTYIFNILYILNTPICFNASASSSESLKLVVCWSYKIIKITTQ